MTLVWLLMLGVFGAVGYGMWAWYKRFAERQRAAEARFASFVAQARPAAAPATAAAVPGTPPSLLPQQKLLFEAAVKTAEAGEPALAIQLYARLLSRFPDTAFAAQARAAVEVQKQKLAKPKAPPPAGPG